MSDHCTRQRLQHLEDLTNTYPAEPYKKKYLPNTLHIVLTLATVAGPSIDTHPTMVESLLMTMWWIQSLHPSHRKSRPALDLRCGVGTGVRKCEPAGCH